MNIQIPKISKDADLIFITIGGNNCDAFSRVVKWCVYVPFIAKEACPPAMKNAMTAVQMIDLALAPLFAKIKAAVPSSARVLVFGYAQFWPEDVNNVTQCENNPHLHDVGSAERANMNTLVLMMNTQINCRGRVFHLCRRGHIYLRGPPAVRQSGAILPMEVNRSVSPRRGCYCRTPREPISQLWCLPS